MRRFFEDRLNVAWVVSAVVLVLVLLLVPNEGVGTALLIVVAAGVIVISSMIRIRDARRDRERKAAKQPGKRG